jgi:hypothetical protein
MGPIRRATTPERRDPSYYNSLYGGTLALALPPLTPANQLSVGENLY